MARQKRLGSEWSLYLPKHDREPRCCFSIAPGKLSLSIPRDGQSIQEGPGLESIATNVTENVTFRENVSRPVANDPFTKSTGVVLAANAMLIRRGPHSQSMPVFQETLAGFVATWTYTGRPLMER
jgi:hypothetical protein